MGRRKRFIDKNNSVTFHVVNRSQQDPLIADETAPQHVLVEATPANKDKQKEEQAKFGVYFDDDYNYLQHLRSRSEVVWECLEDSNARQKGGKESNLKLPSSVFASTVEEEEGMLNKAAPTFGPQPHLDPDIVAALDDDFDFENPDNELEDNFMEHALAEGDSDEDDEDDEYEDYDEDDDFDENVSDIGDLVRKFKQRDSRFDGVETKSRFTEYSVSSSVMRRNEQLTLLDDRFEKFMENYDEAEIGALECEDLEGGDFNYTNDMLIQLATKSKYDQYETYDKKWDKERVRKMQEEASSEEELVEMVVEDDERPKIDCESVLSVASGRSYKPRLIESARKSKKIEIDPRGMPKNVLDSDRGLTVDKINKLNSKNLKEDSSAMSVCAESVISTLSVLSLRPKDETKDEKKERKKLLKEYRAERRIERKANTQAFREEKLRQDRNKINTITKTLT